MTAAFVPTGFDAILIGDESLTIACGDMMLTGGHRLAAVVTRDDAVRRWAETNNLPVLGAPRDLIGAGIKADWLLSIANLRMIPADVLALPTKGAVNFHDGPLPRYAGLNTPAWAIINSETSHGISWHMIEGGVDEGDLLAQVMVPIAPDETAFSLNSKCYAAGMESFGAVLAQLESGLLQREVQDLTQRSYFARDDRPGNMGVLDFGQEASVLSALVRGLDFGDYWNPLTTAKLVLPGTVISVGKLELAEHAADAAAPGTVLSLGAGQITIATASAPVTLRRLTTPEGAAADLTGLVAVGDRIAPAQLAQIPVKDENHWRAALAQAEWIGCPLAGAAKANANYMTRPLNAPMGQDTRALAAALALSALQSAGLSAGTLALAAGGDHPLAARFLPVEIAAQPDTPLTEVAEALNAAIDRAEASAGYARDLIQRDRAIDGDTAPAVGLSFAAQPVAGTVLTFAVTDAGVSLIYDAARLSEAALTLLVARFEQALGALPQAADCAALCSLPEGERALLLEGWNDTETPYDRVTIHSAFEAQVARSPAAEALVFEAQSLSYDDLNRRANRLAHVLITMGAKPGTPIGLYCSRGVDLMVGALAILKAGGAYVPLDPAYPADRIAHYITDSAAPIIVTQSALAAQLPAHQAQVLTLDSDPRLSAAPETNPDAGAGADDLAYLIYTSGSTGTPKGVMVNHGNVANFFAGMDARIDHDAGAVWLAVTSLSFDISVLELFWTLARGFKLVLAGDESRTQISGGPIGISDRTIDFSLFYWGNDDGVGPKKYQLLLEGAKFADAHGFNAVWTPERHFHAFGGPYPNPSVTGAAVAAVTSNLEVRAGSCVAPLHHPARIAEEWAVIDNLTNGRVGLGIASGWQPDDFVLRPENTPPQNKPAMYDCIDQLRRLWRGEAVDFPKKDGTPHAVVTQPRPVSKELAIWVTTAGNPETWREAGEIGANVLTHLLGQSIDEVADKIKIYHDALRAAGHDPANHKVTVMLHTYLADTREEAEAGAREPMKDYLRSAAGLIKQYAWTFPAFKKPKGVTNPFDVNLEDLTNDELEGILEFAFQRYFNDSGLFGTVADGVARAEQLKRIGVDEIACLIDYGIAPAKVLEGLRPLADVLAQANKETVLAEDDFALATQIARHKVTHLQCTPSMAQMLVTNHEAQAALSRLKHLLVGGEALPGTLVKALKGSTHAQLHNMYGPTETTIWSTSLPVAEVDAPVAPIGTPIANTQVYVLDDQMQLLPAGAEGELWIGGAGVTDGYWQRPELSAERFVDNPFGPGRLYRTGDLAAWDADGQLHFAGRADAQVKIRGHRIELGEIEACLSGLADVTQAVVIPREDMPGGAALVGYFTARRPISAEEISAHLAQDLPAIMVPGFFAQLDAMPLTPNKKIDRKALPRPERRKAAREDAPQSAPANATQTAIAGIWSKVLGVGNIRADDNFFGLGGHSLLAVQAHREIRENLGASTLSITDIFRFPTLEALAAHVDGGAGQPAAQTAADAVPAAADPAKSETMSKRRMMRAGRSKAGV